MGKRRGKGRKPGADGSPEQPITIQALEEQHEAVNDTSTTSTVRRSQRKRSPRKLDGVTDLAPVDKDVPKISENTPNCQKQKTKCSKGVGRSLANSTTDTWSVESRKKKRKLSLSDDDDDDREQVGNNCELCAVKEEEITRLQEERDSRRYEEVKAVLEETLLKLKDTASHTSKDEIDKITANQNKEIQSKDESIEGLQEDVSSSVSKTELEELKQEPEDVKTTSDNELKRLEDETVMNNPKDEIETQIDKYNEELRSRDDELESLRYKISTRISQQEFDTMKAEYEQKEHAKNEELLRVREQLGSCVTKGEYEKLRLMYEGEKRAKDDALMRLSTIASSRLRDNNPNIADLSDQNRPTKLAEKLSELYDNQWTDAFDALQYEISEIDTIDFLRDTLLRCYQQCSALTTDGYFEKVQQCIELPRQDQITQGTDLVLSDQLKQQIKEFRKFRAVHVIPDVEHAIKDKLQIAHYDLKEVQNYISCCVEICWLMAVQDPPVILTAETSEKFDTSLFKDYTRRGPLVEYVVWPALLLHEGGPLLAKGVAQGCEIK